MTPRKYIFKRTDGDLVVTIIRRWHSKEFHDHNYEGYKSNGLPSLMEVKDFNRLVKAGRMIPVNE